MATVGLFVLIADTLYTSDEFEDPIYGNLAYAAMFMVVDLTNRTLGAPAARRVVYAATITQGLLFFEYGDFHMTLVGVSAVLWGQLLNVWVFDRLRRRSRWWLPPLASSVAAVILDGFLYFGVESGLTDPIWFTTLLEDLSGLLPCVVAMVGAYRLILKRLPAPWRDAAVAAGPAA